MPRSAYAGLVTRLGALTVDGVVLAIAVSLVINVPQSIWSSLEGESPGWIDVVAQAVAAALPPFYFALFWWGTGQTLGGLLFGTVVRAGDGAHLSLLRAGVRAFVGLLLPVVWLIGLVTVLWDGRRRAFHDRVFGTVVRYKGRATPG